MTDRRAEIARRRRAARKGARLRARRLGTEPVSSGRVNRGTFPPGAVGSAYTATMLALLDVHAATGRATIRDVQYAVGHESPNTTHRHLRHLAELDLVDGVGTAGALRPLVTMHRPHCDG